MSSATLRLSPLMIALATYSSLAAAQQAGTNVPTTAAPPPTAEPLGATPSAITVSSGSIADPNEPMIDATTTHTSFLNRPLFVTGFVLLAGSYGTSAVFGATTDRADDKNLVYPVAGPWLDLANRDCGAANCPREDLYKALLIGSGVLQGLGALGIVTSLFVPEKTTRHWYLVGGETTHVGPSMVGASGYGVGAYGTF